MKKVKSIHKLFLCLKSFIESAKGKAPPVGLFWVSPPLSFALFLTVYFTGCIIHSEKDDGANFHKEKPQLTFWGGLVHKCKLQKVWL